MDQETITEAPGIDSGADTSAGITTEAELANSFLERVEEQPEEKPTETEATDDSDAEAEEDSEGNVLSQSEQSEETETEEDEEAEGVQPKAVSKLLKQVGKLTARAKGAEESVDALKAEIQNLKLQPQQETKEQGQPALEDISSMGDLEKLRKEAMSAKRWALQHVGIGVRKKNQTAPSPRKKSLPLSSVMMKAGKSFTSIRRIASMPSSSYSTVSTLLMQFLAKRAAEPPMLPR